MRASTHALGYLPVRFVEFVEGTVAVVLSARWIALGLLSVVMVFGCKKKSEPIDPLSGIGIPGDKQKVLDAINPAKAAPYSGPTGAVAGTIRIVGDVAPPPEPVTGLTDPQCRVGVPFYQSLFREGPGRTAADVLVAVTGYSGFVPAPEPSVTVTIDEACRYDKRTVVLSYGQTLRVKNDGPRPFNPLLKGSPAAALFVVTPKSDPVTLLPHAPGRFLLEDAAFSYMRAEVFVLKYSTFAVTGLDGRYSIGRIPPGQVKVSALLPTGMLTVEKTVVIKEGETAGLDLELRFDRAAFDQRVGELRREHVERTAKVRDRAILEGRLPVEIPASSADAGPAASAGAK